MSPKTAKIAVAHAVALAILVVLLLTHCGEADEGPTLSADAERGRQWYAVFCSSCHNGRDPFARGLQGPPIARSSRELLEARVLHDAYPPGYVPKQDTDQMVALPYLENKIGDLYAFLAEVPEPAR